MLVLLALAHATTFTEVPGAGHQGAGPAGSGLGVGDLDGDGWLDIVSLGNAGGFGGEVMLQDPASPLTFVNVTASVAPGFDERDYRRGVIVADLDNDGRRDVVLWSSNYAAVFLQDHDPGSGAWVLGQPDGSADLEIIDEDWALSNEPGNPNTYPYINLEGIGLVDHDRDQRLDLLAAFRFTGIYDVGFPDDAVLVEGLGGLPSASAGDDYSVMEDMDGDGEIDIAVARDGADIFWSGGGVWTPDVSLSLDNEPYKGAVLACDFDDDGDLDLFRTLRPNTGVPLPPAGSTAANQIWLDTAAGWVSAGNPGVDETAATWGASCGDVDNDGDLDLVVGYFDGGLDVLYNNGVGNAWTADSSGVVTSALVGGLALADFDRDGALDLYVQETGSNELWENDLSSDAFVTVEVQANVGTCQAPMLVDDFHARLRVSDPVSGSTSGVRLVPGPMGLGTSGGNPVHIGLGAIPSDQPVELEIQPYMADALGGSIPVTTVSVTPADHPYHHVSVRTDDPDGDGIPNSFEGLGDADGDGLPDRADLDSDDDGWLDSEEAGDPCAPLDTDGDGDFDFQDADADGDGVTDDADCDRLDPSVTVIQFWSDGDGDGYGTGSPIQACSAPSGFVDQSGDCNDGDGAIHPGAAEECDPVDRDCDGSGTLGATDTTTGWLDFDGDGFGNDAEELSACSLPSTYVGVAGDCDDTQATVNPAETEVCDGLDNDCVDGIDGPGAIGATDWWPDGDNDGFGAGTAVVSCTQPSGHRADDSDCNDTNGSVFPGAPEQCNSLDDNCDGSVDENLVDSSWYPDGDGDGFAPPGSTAVVDCIQPAGHVLNLGDCDDGDGTVNPGAVDVCNGVDDNCSGDEDDAVDAATFYNDLDGDGWGNPVGSVVACAAPTGTADRLGDCNDLDPTISPDATEVCNGIDDDCTLVADDNAVDAVVVWLDGDGDGYGDPAVVDAACPGSVPTGFVEQAGDCDDSEPLAWEDADEVCDGADNDCNGLVDAADPGLPAGATNTWYADADGDGFGAGAGVDACTPPSGHVGFDGDCDDAAATVYPGASEVPGNGIDEDCDGVDSTEALDTDGDGLPDAEETPGDFDGDGLENIEDPDSDDDGVLDGAETSPEAVLDAGDVAPREAPSPVYGCAAVPAGGATGMLGLVAGLVARSRRCTR